MDEKPAPRRLIFAVWHWPRWVWLIAVPLSPIIYFLSAPPLMYLLVALAPWMPRIVFGVLYLMLLPAMWCSSNVGILYAIHAWENAILEQLFGPLGA